jgi:expansin (peptidoglycan-binding protein)
MENGYYVTACGYQGTEQNGNGQNAVDTALDIASSGRASSEYFAAIPSVSSNDFDTVNSCGACVEITNGNVKVIATVIDACPKNTNPPCQSVGHLDLSTQVFDALGYQNGSPMNTTWQFVACPVTGNVQARLKNGNLDQLYLVNVVFPIVSVTSNAQQATHLSYGAWQLANGQNAGGATITMTDVEGHILTATVPGGGGDLGVQFPSPGNCP